MPKDFHLKYYWTFRHFIGRHCLYECYTLYLISVNLRPLIGKGTDFLCTIENMPVNHDSDNDFLSYQLKVTLRFEKCWNVKNSLFTFDKIM